jgi:hypothetical protein
MEHSPDQPRSWRVERRRKKKMASSARLTTTTNVEDDNVFSEDIQETPLGPEWEEDGEEDYSSPEDDDGPQGEPCTELEDELELRQLSVLRRMAKKGADPTRLRETVRELEASPHRQSKLKNLRRNLKKSDDRDSSVGSGGRLWVHVDESGCPTGLRRPDWLSKLRGYSRDLDWSIDNFKEHPRPLLIAIKEKMAAQFEYRGGLGDVPEEVFFQILRQQMRTRRANMKKLIDKGVPLPGYVKKQHLENFKKLIARTDKIAEASRMKAYRQTVQNLSHSGRSEGEVRSRLVSDVYNLNLCCDHKYDVGMLT